MSVIKRFDKSILSNYTALQIEYQLRKNWIKHGKILSLVKINSAKTQLTQFWLSCCQRADFSVLSQKRWDKLALFYKHNTNPNENSQFKHWFYIRSYRVKLNSSVLQYRDFEQLPIFNTKIPTKYCFFMLYLFFFY